MKKYLFLALVVALILYFTGLFTDFIQLFKLEDGHTNWQYVANWSSGILILALTITVGVLFFSRAETARANLELTAIRNDLEIRVQERTATLDESNRLLKEEIEQHLETTNRLHASETYIKNVLESMPTMLVGLNARGEITHWNKKAEKNTGIAVKDALGKYLWDAYPIITVTKGQVSEALEKNVTLNFKQSQRDLFHYDITIYPLNGSIEPGVVILIVDMTNQVKSENKLIQRDKMSAMGELASSMAHDINVPVQAIFSDLSRARELVRAMSGQVRSGCEPLSGQLDQLDRELQDVKSQGKHAAAIISNLLNFASSHDDTKQEAYVTEIMDHTIELARSALSLPHGLRFTDLTIERDYDQELPLLPCFVSEIQQVFLSLLRHCFYSIGEVDREDFIPVIRVRVLECYDALWIKISHNGKGLTSEEQQYIFEPYFSNEKPEVEYDAGKRLSFPYFIMTEHHNGQMAVTSDINAGTTFHIQLQLNA
ncbi:MAG: PAS domain-containing sensor histidine kinase [Proteobacteria bacterium]|nr:MAG: PAS domain-containing sensor histidine kinase [Pseudomonadota bacterium]PIE40036.1 MAG: PAS domain-containing sensor histidine kinase [Gammaproteobacteria bacterium]